MGIDPIQRCDCGYYLRADELIDDARDEGSADFHCPACGQQWGLSWRVDWERIEAAGEPGKGGE